jgi:hypothetical protein
MAERAVEALSIPMSNVRNLRLSAIGCPLTAAPTHAPPNTPIPAGRFAAGYHRNQPPSAQGSITAMSLFDSVGGKAALPHGGGRRVRCPRRATELKARNAAPT